MLPTWNHKSYCQHCIKLLCYPHVIIKVIINTALNFYVTNMGIIKVSAYRASIIYPTHMGIIKVIANTASNYYATPMGIQWHQGGPSNLMNPLGAVICNGIKGVHPTL
jgi:hypothetical protein